MPTLEIAIGPEGGWAPEEEALFDANGWRAVSLGPRILRAETAAIAALAVVASTAGVGFGEAQLQSLGPLSKSGPMREARR